MKYRRRTILVLAVCIGLTLILTQLVTAQNENLPLAAQNEDLMAQAQNVNSLDAAGDSITKGFNAQSAFLCPNADQEQYNWSTSDTNGTSLCSIGSEGVFSLRERLECAQGVNVISPSPNHARSGAQMLKDFANQATNIKNYIITQPAPRMTTVFMGHNDVCGGKLLKYQFSCPAGSDQDPNNYCRTTPAAFEREFRKGLDILITVPDMKIAVASLVRVSQLCNFTNKQNCQLFNSCQALWQTFDGLDTIFGSGNGICGSLTLDCSDTRVADAYRTAKAFHDILKNVTIEYAMIREGDKSNVVTIGGQTVGGATKAIGSTLVYSDAPWVYKFNSSQLSCCDCFHPSKYGQDALARIARNGLTCSPTDVCCQDTGDPVKDGKCSKTNKNGTFYPGFF